MNNGTNPLIWKCIGMCVLACATATNAIAGWTGENNISQAGYGWSVAGAGDVNGDGYDDVVVGAPFSTINGQEMQGYAYVYHGSATGLNRTASAKLQNSQSGWVLLGSCVSGAGDVNGDGYDDVIVGAPHYNHVKHNEGRAYVFMGSAKGISSTPAWLVGGRIFEGLYGCSVGAAGDVNGDGYADVLVGQESRGTLVYYGSASGLRTTPAWITSVGTRATTAGDVNNDGFADVVVYATPNDRFAAGYSPDWATAAIDGLAYVFLGSANGLSANPAQVLDEFSVDSACAAGDVNGDGYDDVLVGNAYEGSFSGAAYLHLGSAQGLQPSASWSGEIGGDFAFFGTSVAAGDLDGDGFVDVVAVAEQEPGEQYDHPYTTRAYAFRGSASGFATNATLLLAVAEGELYFSRNYSPIGTGMSSLIAAAGDVNRDGRCEFIMGAPSMANGQVQEGRAYLLNPPAAWLPTLSASPETLILSSAGSNGYSLAVAANVSWTATVDRAWIAVAGANSGSNNGVVKLNVAANPGAARTGAILMRGAKIVYTCMVQQASGLVVPGQPVAGDVDGDLAADAAVYRPANGTWSFQYSAGGSATTAYGWSTVKPVPADYDGDGQIDLAVYDPAGGKWYIRQSSAGDRVESFGWSATIPLPGDYDGDGRADLAVFYQKTAQWYLRLTSIGRDSNVGFGWSATIPVPADYDGDGATDLAVYHPAGAKWYVAESSTGNVVEKSRGGGRTLPVPADYDGDGKADAAVFYQGKWTITLSGSGADRVSNFGWSATLPVPADYDGDGKADLAVYHPAGAKWYVLSSQTGATLVKSLGGSDRQPVLLNSLIHSWFKMN